MGPSRRARNIARTGKRTTQGGPPNGDRKYGTGGGPAVIEVKKIPL
jgi:hypothetical protein